MASRLVTLEKTTKVEKEVQVLSFAEICAR
jgi:hypothetical protein